MRSGSNCQPYMDQKQALLKMDSTTDVHIWNSFKKHPENLFLMWLSLVGGSPEHLHCMVNVPVFIRTPILFTLKKWVNYSALATWNNWQKIMDGKFDSTV